LPRNAGEDSEGTPSLFSLAFFVFRSTPMGPNKRLKALQQEKADIVQRMEAMLDAADKEGHDLTADEEKDYQELEASLPALDKRIKREQDFLNAQASQQPIRDLNRDTREEAAARIGQVHARRDPQGSLTSSSAGQTRQRVDQHPRRCGGRPPRTINRPIHHRAGGETRAC
jgi:hypothetical protein